MHLSEKQLIQLIYDHFDQTPCLHDDAFQLPNVTSSVVAIDALVEGHHFDFRFAPPKSIGHRALARPISDIYATGAEPYAFYWHICCPNKLATRDFWQATLEGCRYWLKQHPLQLLGGDLTIARDGTPLSFSVTVLGRQGDLHIRRSGACEGDYIILSERIGASAAELEYFLKTPGQHDVDCAHLYPRPDYQTAQRIAACANCMIDLSDDLTSALEELERVNDLRFCLDPTLDVKATSNLPVQILDKHIHFGGEDYALLCTVPENRICELPEQAISIGRVKKRV